MSALRVARGAILGVRECLADLGDGPFARSSAAREVLAEAAEFARRAADRCQVAHAAVVAALVAGAAVRRTKAGAVHRRGPTACLLGKLSRDARRKLGHAG
jgi:hypothetical protein